MLYETAGSDEGFKILSRNEKWMIAVLNILPQFLRDNISAWERHTETDEAFLLLEGSCTMLVAGNGEKTGDIEAVPLKRNEIFVAKKYAWHTHILSEDAKVLVIENSDTNEDNTMRCDMTSDEKKSVLKLTAK